MTGESLDVRPPTQAILKGLAVAMPLCLILLLATHPKVRQSASCFITLPSGSSGGGGGGEAEYAFVNFVGENSTMETRSCGWIEGLRSSETPKHQHYPRQIVNFMPFNNELDLLKFRMMEHWDVIDRFVIIESPLSYSKREKPLYFGDALCERFAPFARKLVHVVLDPQLSMGKGVWEFEHTFRDAIVPVARMLGLLPDDLLLSADTDEIPYGTAVLHAANSVWNALRAGGWPNSSKWPVISFDLQLYFFSLFHKVKITWNCQAAMYPVGLLANLTKGATAFRFSLCDNPPLDVIQLFDPVSKAGVHASYCFPMEGIVTKVRSFSHYDIWEDKNDTQVIAQIKEWINENKSWEEMDGGLREPHTNPDLFAYRPDVRDALIAWTLELHRKQMEA